MSDTEEAYLVQCISGEPSHVMQAVQGSELEAMCFQRAESGKLDALILSTDECPTCVIEAQSRRSRDFEMYMGCPMEDLDGNCVEDCPCKSVIPDSPWNNQVQGIALSS